MPELPEVETIRRDLAPRLAGARIDSLWTSGKALRLARAVDVAALERACVGRRVTGLRRRAKYLLLDLEGTGTVLIHLGMSGRLVLARAVDPRPAHTHVAWRLAGGGELRFVDPRRFGLVALLPPGAEAVAAELSVLGVDPLSPELTATGLQELARGTRRCAKVFLLDQARVAGLGNIYACEALFEARIHPLAPVDRLRARRLEALRAAIVVVLERALRNRGTTFRDYTDGNGEAGGNQRALRVYGREGEACPRGDGGRVRREVIQGRSTYFCSRCQTR